MKNDRCHESQKSLQYPFKRRNIQNCFVQNRAKILGTHTTVTIILLKIMIIMLSVISNKASRKNLIW